MSTHTVQTVNTRIPFKMGCTCVMANAYYLAWSTEMGKMATGVALTAPMSSRLRAKTFGSGRTMGIILVIWELGNVPDASKMKSCQNGLLLSASVHTSFDSCLISVNPDVSISEVFYYDLYY